MVIVSTKADWLCKFSEGFLLIPPFMQALSALQSADEFRSVAEAEERVRRRAEYLRNALGKSYLGDAPGALGGAAVVSDQVVRQGYLDCARRRSSSTPTSLAQVKPSVAARLARVQTPLHSLQKLVNCSAKKGRPAQQVATASGKCYKCDEPHETDSCPHFKKKREPHKDTWANYGVKGPRTLGADSGNFVLRAGHCVQQPPDGSCLFHSLCHGLNGLTGSRLSAAELRAQLADFIASIPELDIAGDTIEEWVQWDSNSDPSSYARRMARGGWGGGLEMAACSLLKKVNVHVYERRPVGFKRISCFDSPVSGCKAVHVLYQGGVHYDALVTT